MYIEKKLIAVTIVALGVGVFAGNKMGIKISDEERKHIRLKAYNKIEDNYAAKATVIGKNQTNQLLNKLWRATETRNRKKARANIIMVADVLISNHPDYKNYELPTQMLEHTKIPYKWNTNTSFWGK
ncbi:MAG: hypothetical protein U9N59_10500 [Campylobacterota bacterium]|nr:hypothetical protein [Campylobacterota bacterium]